MPPSPIALALLTSVGAQIAGAAPPRPAPDVALDYRSPTGCPARAAVVEQLGARGLVVDDAAGERRLSLDVSADRERFNGKLSIEVARQPRVSRSLDGRDCDAVVLSLVLIAALALNPPVDAPATDALATRAPLERPASEPAAAAVVASPPPTSSSPTWLLGLSGRGMSGIAARPALGLVLAVERIWRRGARFSPSVGLSAVTVAPPTASLSVGTADFRAVLARLDACWFGGVISTTRFLVSPCAEIEAGVLQGRGVVAQPETARRPWVAPGASVRALGALTRGVWLSATGSVFAPLVRDEFLFKNPDTVIHRTDAVGAGLEVGIVAVLW